MHSHKRRRLGEVALHTTSIATPPLPILLHGHKVVTPAGILSPGYILIASTGTITSITSTPPHVNSNVRTRSAPLIVPGFVDIHNHGVGGAEDVVDYWNNPSYTLHRLARLGTTSVLSTVVFPDGQLERSKHTCQQISSCVNTTEYGCVLRGIHGEGPIVATLGGLPDSSKQTASKTASFDEFLEQVVGPHLKIMTISPSADAARQYERIQCLAARNVRVSLGHDKNCTEQDILGALHAVAPDRCHMTHAFNVQQFHHRNSGLANFALVGTFPNLPCFQGIEPPTVEVIGDLKHVSALTLRALLGARSTRDVCVITDAIAENVPGKQMKYSSDRWAEVSADGETVNIAGTSLLCGSCTNMHATFQRMVHVLGVDLMDAVQLTATTPARIVGLDDVVGSIQVGLQGDVLLLDEGELTLLGVVVSGREIWSCDSPNELRLPRPSSSSSSSS